MNISFSGIDGCGKSTQIEILKKKLSTKNKTYKYFHLFSKNNTALASIQEYGTISKILKKMRKSKLFINKIILFFLRAINALIDSNITISKNNKLKYDFIIYDRYFYDVLIHLAYDYPFMRGIVMWLNRFLPKPNIILIFHIDPQASIDRVNELTYEKAETLNKLYNQLAKDINVKVIDSTLSIEKISNIILSEINNVK